MAFATWPPLASRARPMTWIEPCLSQRMPAMASEISLGAASMTAENKLKKDCWISDPGDLPTLAFDFFSCSPASRAAY